MEFEIFYENMSLTFYILLDSYFFLFFLLLSFIPSFLPSFLPSLLLVLLYLIAFRRHFFLSNLSPFFPFFLLSFLTTRFFFSYHFSDFCPHLYSIRYTFLPFLSSPPFPPFSYSLFICTVRTT